MSIGLKTVGMFAVLFVAISLAYCQFWSVVHTLVSWMAQCAVCCTCRVKGKMDTSWHLRKYGISSLRRPLT